MSNALTAAAASPDHREVTTAPGGAGRFLPAVLALAYALLFLAGLYFVTAFHEHPTYPAPGEPIGRILDYFARNVANVRSSVLLSYAAELFLGVFVAVLVGRLRRLGAHGALVDATLFAGVAVAFVQIASHLAEWTLTFPGLGLGGTLAAYYLSYGLGGPAFSVAMGVFVGLFAAVGATARLLPVWVVATGAVIAAIGLVSWLNLVQPEAPALSVLIPLTRFPALLWLVLAAATLRPTAARR